MDFETMALDNLRLLTGNSKLEWRKKVNFFLGERDPVDYTNTAAVIYIPDENTLSKVEMRVVEAVRGNTGDYLIEPHKGLTKFSVWQVLARHKGNPIVTELCTVSNLNEARAAIAGVYLPEPQPSVLDLARRFGAHSHALCARLNEISDALESLELSQR